MPLRTNAKSPGEFIRDHLQETPGQRDYVGSMYSAYKLHLKDVGVSKFPCRQTFHTYIYLLNHTGAVAFDGAEAIGFGGEEPEDLPDGYIPACGMPAPRHFYRMISFGHPAFLSPKRVWREQRGLPVPTAPRPRPVPTAPRLIAPVAEPVAEVEEAPVVRRPGRRNRLQRLIDEGQAFIPRLESLRSISPTARVDLDRLEQEMLDYFDRLLDLAEGARPELRRQLRDLATPLERAAEGFEKARDALDNADPVEYQAAIDLLLTCCSPVALT